MSVNTTPFPLGVYVGGPNESDPAAEASFEAQFNAFTQAMGAKPQYMDAFTNFTSDWSNWIADQTFVSQSWAKSPVLQGVTPVITLPMADSGQQSDPDASYKAIVAGQYDSVFTGIINAWKSAGYGTLDARIGYEMNGTWQPFSMGSDPATVSDWAAAFQHIANLVHNIPGETVKTIWNPAEVNWTAQPTVNAYPGDQYVDIIGVDIYSFTYPVQLYDWALNNGTVDSNQQQWFSNPVNREHYWTNPNATQWDPNGNDPSQWGLAQTLQFAELHDKPLGLAETGAGGDGTTNGPVDDAAFPQFLASELSQPGAPKVAFANIWDSQVSDGNWTFTDGSRPQEEAAWQKYFGSSLAVTTPIAGSGTPTTTLSANATATFVDRQRQTYSLPVEPGATKSLYINNTGLIGNVWQWTEPGGVIGLGAGDSSLVPVINLQDQTGSSYHVAGLAEADVSLSGASTTPGTESTLLVDQAMRGTLNMGSGNYNFTVNAQSSWVGDAYNTFRANLGSGTDGFTLFGDPTKTLAILHAGSGSDQVNFINTKDEEVYAGTGQAIVNLGNGVATAYAGSGTMDVRGGGGVDTYVFNAGDNLLTVENFSAAKGDTLQVDPSLQASMTQTVSTTGLMVSFGIASQGIMLPGVTSPLSSASIDWS